MLEESRRIADQLRRAYEGDAWHGPSLTELLSGLTASQAASHPIPGVHSIWELVLHITAWERAGRRRISGKAATVTAKQNFPRVVDRSERAWKKALQDLERGDKALRKAVSGLSEKQLARKVPGRSHTAYLTAHGIVQHNLYHAGQIALLKKAIS